MLCTGWILFRARKKTCASLQKTPNPSTWNSSPTSRIYTDQCSLYHFIYRMRSLDQYSLGRLRVYPHLFWHKIRCWNFCCSKNTSHGPTLHQLKDWKRPGGRSKKAWSWCAFPLLIPFAKPKSDLTLTFPYKRRHKERDNLFNISIRCSMYLLFIQYI